MASLLPIYGNRGPCKTEIDKSGFYDISTYNEAVLTTKKILLSCLEELYRCKGLPDCDLLTCRIARCSLAPSLLY